MSDEDRYLRVEENDPTFNKLFLLKHGRTDDWKRLGEAIRNNTHIKELTFGGLPFGLQHDTMFQEFCRVLAANKSIEEVRVGCSLLNGMLSPFVEQNHNLCSLHVARCHYHGVKVLHETLSKSSSLRIFSIAKLGVMDEQLKDITLALTNHPQLTEIDYSKNQVELRGVTALATLLGSPQCLVTDLSLWECSLNDETAHIFAGALTNNRSLRRMSLAENPLISITGWRSIIPQLSSFEEVKLWGNSIDNEAASLLADVIVNSSHLQELNLASSHCIDTTGWQSIFDALQHPSCALRKMLLHNNSFDNEDLVHLTQVLISGGSSLKVLALSNIDSISDWGPLITLLQSPLSKLEELDIEDSTTIDEDISSIANSLVGNTNLKSLILTLYKRTESIWEDSFVRLLCNEATIIDTYNSNHTLQRISNSYYPLQLDRLLRINQECTPAEAARRKIIQVHFSSDISMEPFIDMDCEVFPHVIAWMARDGYGKSLVYQFLRNFTFMLDVSGLNQSESVSSTRPTKRSRV